MFTCSLEPQENGLLEAQLFKALTPKIMANLLQRPLLKDSNFIITTTCWQAQYRNHTNIFPTTFQWLNDRQPV